MGPRSRRSTATLRLTVVCGLLLAGALAARDGLDDRDGDGIADHYDPFPDDPDRPGRVDPDTVYANTSNELFRIAPSGDAVQRVGSFRFSDGRARAVTDIAIDPWGVMWASSFDAIMVCHPQRASCEVMRSNSSSINALEHARGPTGHGAAQDIALYAASTDGGLYRVDRSGQPRRIGELGGPSSGDLVPFASFIAAARDEAQGPDTLVAFAAGELQRREVGPLPDTQIYGMARCDGGETIALDASGRVYLDQGLAISSWRQVGQFDLAWWGASCAPAAFGLPGEDAAPVDAPEDPRTPENPSGSAPRPGPTGSWCGLR